MVTHYCASISILNQLYQYTSLLDHAIHQLCGVSITQNSDTTPTSLHTFCTTTILASNQRDVFFDPARSFTARKQERSLRSIISSSTDKHGLARCADHMNNLSQLHKKLGDEVMVAILTKSALFARVGENYLQITGIPLYNVLALSHTPLVTKCHPMTRRRNRQQLKRKETDGLAQEEVNEPPLKKVKLSGVNREVANRLRSDDNNTSRTIVIPQRSTLSNPTPVSRDHSSVTVSASDTEIHEKLTGKAQNANSRRKIRKHPIADGAGVTSSAERCMNQKIRCICNTSFRKMAVMYSTSSNEGLSKSHELNVFKASRRGAIRLVTSIFITKNSRAAQKKQQRKSKKQALSRLSKRYQPLVPLFQQLLSNYQKKAGKFVHVLNSIATPPLTTIQEVREGGLIFQFQCNHCQVTRFLICLLNVLVPKQLWGSPQNKKNFFSYVQRFVVGLRKWERVSVRQLLEGFKTSHCWWSRPNGQRRSCRSDSQKQTEMVGRFFIWLMHLVVELVKGFFYATEHCHYHNRVMYFRKPVWNQLCKAALADREVMFQRLSQEEVDYLLFRGKCLGVSNIRFMPKASSLRPITNLGKAAKLNSAQFPLSKVRQREIKSVNSQLIDLFNVLKFEKSRRPESSSCLGYRDIQCRLNGFSSRLSRMSGFRQPLYLVALDITNCFDSVEARLLYSVIQKRILTEKSYLLRRYATVMVYNGCIRRSFIKVGTTRELCKPFLKHVEASSLRNAIFIDMVTYPLIDRLQLLSQLKSHLFKNIIKFRNQYFRQTKGIPQGSCISSLLCSYYYDEMVKEHLPPACDKDTLLIHYVDDFLLMTRDQTTAKNFLQTMTVGIPRYNCVVNASKTSTNFKVGEDGTVVLEDEKEWMAWCGLLINTRNLEVRSDYSRYTNKKIRDHLTVITHSRPFHNLHRLVQKSVRLKCQPIFLDCKLLSEKTVLCNVYQLFLLAAVKTHAAVRALQLHGPTLKKYTKFFFSVIKQCSKVFYRRATITCRKSGNTSFTPPLELCTWLCCHAYKRVFQAKNSHGYRLLVKILSSQISSVADTMGLPQVKRCLRATTLAECQTIINFTC